MGEHEQDEDITETEDADTELQTPGVPAPAAEAAEAAEVDTPQTGYYMLYSLFTIIILQVTVWICKLYYLDTLSESNEELEAVEESINQSGKGYNAGVTKGEVMENLASMDNF